MTDVDVYSAGPTNKPDHEVVDLHDAKWILNLDGAQVDVLLDVEVDVEKDVDV